MPNLVQIGQTVAEIWRFFDFSNMAAVRRLAFVMRVFRPPTKSTWWFYRSAKFRWNGHCSLEDMRVSILCQFGVARKFSFMPLLGEVLR